ncbi:MAG: hypothetical protein KBB64_06585 [Bacteroidia bacterium]|nr:hypothetical protein [Bacteroidia bacterium]
MSPKRLLAGIAIAFTTFSACTTEPNLDNVPEIKFSTDVQRILSSHCNFEGCHGGAGGGEFSLQTYADVMGYVESGDAHASNLYKVITKRGFVEERMPPSGYQTVSAEDVKLIYWWIEQGAKNN